MAKISNTLAYPNQNPINPEDYLIGTDGLSSPIELQTKTFTIAGLADYILNIVTPPASSETFIVNGMFKAIGSNSGGGVGPEFSKDFLEWTSAVTPSTQVPLWKVPVTLKLKLVTWAWVSDVVMNIPQGDTMTVSIGEVANNAISNYANYSKKENLFVISDLYDKSYPRGEVDVSDLNIVLNAFQNIGVVCEGSLNSGITPTDGDMELSFYFEKTNSIAPIPPVTVTLNPFNNNIIDNTPGAPNYRLEGNELNDIKQGQPGVSYQFITNGLANTGYQFKASAPFTATNPGGIFTVDGTETQTLTGEIEVVPITPVGPEWTSTNPVDADTYPNLQPNDTWTYNWTTSDDNTPCADLDYLITVDGVEIFPAAGASWLVFTDNGDCTGTLTGQYPGGNIDVVMTVTDNDGLSATQDFTISGLTVTGDTYFTFWSDTSGSMNTTIEETAKMTSVPEIYVDMNNGWNMGANTIREASGTANYTQAGYVSNPNGKSSLAGMLVEPGMLIEGTGIPANTFVGTINYTAFRLQVTLVDANGTTVSTTSGDGGNSVCKFTRTSAQKSADYLNTTNFRNLLQDFYATGGTEASGNTDRATNGSDEYDSHVYWGMSMEERQLGMLGNKGLGQGTGPGEIFENADNVVIFGFGDESGGTQFVTDNYQMNANDNDADSWKNRDNATNAAIIDDITLVRNFIANANFTYRSQFFSTTSESGGGATIIDLLGPNSLVPAANISNPPVSTSFPAGEQSYPATIPATAYSNVTMLDDYTTSTPKLMRWSDELSVPSPVPPDPALVRQFWYDEIKASLQDMGFNV
jgi:hypothetical protein